MAEREDLVASILATTSDYRDGEIAAPTSAHIERWIGQFDADVQLPILREMDHVLDKTYFKKKDVDRFLTGLIRNEKLVGSDPEAFWKSANFLNIQRGGGSQHDMLIAFDKLLRAELGFGIEESGSEAETFIYIDDAIFTGGRVKSDVSPWIIENAPKSATLHVLVIAIHEGFYYNRDRIAAAAKQAGKTIDIKWWRIAMFENRKFYRNSSDILWPVNIPDDAATIAHVEKMEHEPAFRAPGNIGPLKIFSSDDARQLLEREFLKAGVRIRDMCPNLPVVERPLGHSYLETLGFGSTLVTYRNCPNNAPLAYWAGDPWYPLFPRKTNSESRLEKLFRGLKF
ncbi:MAG: hypothetical protein ABL311_11280 [Nitratireductor rhodophyticola]|uniref:phosphoribosyltransferase-like protein n=1 Tax=Nitratireductor rhodophyticola TaxID=2854036 RepID=UPI0032D904DF